MTNTKVINLTVGAIYQCRPLFMDQNGKPMLPAPTGTTYASGTPATATVDANGKVTAVGAGTSTITATKGNLSTTLTVSVYIPVPAKMSL
jgi:uncharacterized protein YjdB